MLRQRSLARLRHDAPWARAGLTLTIAALTLLPGADFAAGDAPALTAKGIYHDVDRYQRSGLKFQPMTR